MSAQSLAIISDPIFKPELVRRLLFTFFSGEWTAGDRLPEVELARRFGISRTPVREALQELATIGLIDLRPNCGAIARPCGIEEVREIYEVRGILESAATRLACGRIEPRKIEALTAEFALMLASPRRDATWSRREWAADRRLHEMIAAASGNRRLADEITRYGQLIQVIREVVGNLREAQVDAITEHLVILKALRANKPQAAAEAMRRHLDSASAHAIDALRPLLATGRRTHR